MLRRSAVLRAYVFWLFATLAAASGKLLPHAWSDEATQPLATLHKLSGDGSHRRSLRDTSRTCEPLTRELVLRVARNNTILLTAIDKLAWKTFGPSYIENIAAANITYWLIAALDPETSRVLGELGVTNCFNAPADKLKYIGTDTIYHWGSHHWSQTTWNKVHMVRTVYEMGVHVIHSDADVVWFKDPLPYFISRGLNGPAHILVGVDALSTNNAHGEVHVEFNSNPFTNINTGIYFVRQWPGGLDFFDNVWLPMQQRNIGHDQDGFNWVVRGAYFRHDIGGPFAIFPDDPSLRVYLAAYSNTTAVAFLPPSMFANTYTFVNVRLWERLEVPLYAVHWVWGGRTIESKRQCMRDAMKFHDEPEYYTSPYLVTFDLDQLQMPPDFNSWQDTEVMIRFHVTAANHQLQQAYYAFATALITNRTLVIPRFLCYCSKNWYQTQRCRINEETATVFPFICSLSQLLRAKRLDQGFTLPSNSQYGNHKVFIREYSFLDNPKVPDLIKTSFLEVVPSGTIRPIDPTVLDPDQLILDEGPASRGYGRRVTVAAPLSDVQLAAVLGRYPRARIVHLPHPTQLMSVFSRSDTWKQFDAEIQKVVAYWCCRTPPDMQAMNLTDKLQLVALPPSRYDNLPHLEGSSYLHQLGPIKRRTGTPIK